MSGYVPADGARRVRSIDVKNVIQKPLLNKGFPSSAPETKVVQTAGSFNLSVLGNISTGINAHRLS